jgi:simple sugar transport system permease protein
MRELWSLLKTVISPGTFNQMLRSATPVALAAMGGALTEHAGIMNIGMDGMILLGAFVGVIGSYLTASAGLGVLAAVGLGVLVGLLFALFVVKLRSDEFIIGCALNTFAAGATAYLSRAIFGLSGTSGHHVTSLPRLHLNFLNHIPFLGKILNHHSVFVYVTWILVLLMWLFVYKTPWGFWLRASGEQPETLRTAGVSPERMQWLASILCGVFCGLAGAHLSLGYLNGTFTENMSNSRGFIAFACVIFSAANPSKAYLAALMFGFFDALGYRLQGVISSDLTATIPYLITVVMMVYVVVRSRRRRKKNLRQHESLGNLS